MCTVSEYSMDSGVCNTARMYNCAGCRAQIVICRSCDRGHIYCAECAPKMRQAANRRKVRKYQATEKGRQNHAIRQRLYREKLKLKVTHPGSFTSQLLTLLRQKQKRTALTSKLPIPRVSSSLESIRCHICCSSCSPFIRLDFLLKSA
jgi:hypothetical protein